MRGKIHEAKYRRAITLATEAVLESADPEKGADGLDQALRVFMVRLRKHMAHSLIDALEEMRGLSTEELRKVAGEPDGKK